MFVGFGVLALTICTLFDNRTTWDSLQRKLCRLTCWSTPRKKKEERIRWQDRLHECASKRDVLLVGIRYREEEEEIHCCQLWRRRTILSAGPTEQVGGVLRYHCVSALGGLRCARFLFHSVSLSRPDPSLPPLQDKFSTGVLCGRWRRLRHEVFWFLISLLTPNVRKTRRRFAPCERVAVNATLANALVNPLRVFISSMLSVLPRPFAYLVDTSSGPWACWEH